YRDWSSDVCSSDLETRGVQKSLRRIRSRESRAIRFEEGPDAPRRRRHHPEPSEDHGRHRKCQSLPDRGKGVRELRRVHLAFRGSWTDTEQEEDRETNPGTNKGIGRNERGPEESRLQI